MSPPSHSPLRAENIVPEDLSVLPAAPMLDELVPPEVIQAALATDRWFENPDHYLAKEMYQRLVRRMPNPRRISAQADQHFRTEAIRWYLQRTRVEHREVVSVRAKAAGREDARGEEEKVYRVVQRKR